jgi:hypothetical protein
MKKTILKLHWMSFDVAIGAVCGGVFFSERINLNILLALGLSTWILYLVDRLFDIRQNADIQTIRHQFHQRNERNIWILVLILSITNFVNLWFLPVKTIYFGLILGGTSLIYGLVVFKTKINSAYFKEIVVSAIYTAGITAGLSQNYLLIFAFFLVAWQSLLLFSRFELIENPAAKNSISIIGDQAYYLIFAYIFGFLLTCFLLKLNSHFSILLLMIIALILVELFHKKLLINNLYRIIGELVFWIPFLSILKYD